MVFCNGVGVRIRRIRSLSHNPYFNRWFSAIEATELEIGLRGEVTILILIDGFLQYGILL